MKAKDLMIGDWVRIMQPKDFHGNERRLQVTEISEADDSICYFSGDAGGELTISTRHLEPIPLTREILEMNGFERSEVFVEWKYENDDVYMIYKPFPYLKIQTEESTVAFPCKYIHELQHALRLCGIEKEITL